ncbi:hypothetical protein [Kordiimonas pumila]|uniref:YfdX family protein n=1 Tax=Kordiimonas pumila TaxID=2161677 RepID=A0ABV7D356_9PROT|nr:hypothetical protein [Kordiimonas pumila]
MRPSTFALIAALSASIAVPPVAIAAVGEKPVANTPVYSEDTFLEEKQDLLNLLFQAQMSVQRGAKEETERHINKAFEKLEMAVKAGASSEDFTKTQVSRVVELKFGSSLMPKVVYVPIGDDDLDMSTLSKALTLKGIDRGDVEGAEIHYVRLRVIESKLIHDLNEAREELTDDDFGGTRDQIIDAQKSMIYEASSAQKPEEVAKDHVTLTRYMLKVAEYEGARKALDVAETALVAIRLNADAAGHNTAEVDKIRVQADELDEMISRRDPTLFEQIDHKLESWWEKLG